VIKSTILTYAEAARLIGVSRARVSQLVATGVLGTVLVNGRRYVSGSSLVAYARDVADKRVSDRRYSRKGVIV
jgi:excisionase family DNA binding protein